MKDKHARVLVLAASAKDADSSAKLLAQANIECTICEDLHNLEREIKIGAGVILIAKEVLIPSTIAHLSLFLDTIQPAWSFLPIILLVSSGDLTRGNEATLRALKPLRNSTLLERPVRLGTFLTVIQASLADRKRQYRVRDLLAALEKSRSEAIAASEAKSSFLANMSHEIRTPLGAILGFSELLAEESTSKEEKELFVETIQRSGQLLSALIDDILDLAKVESGNVAVESIQVRLSDLVTETISTLKSKASAKNILLLVELDSRLPIFIETDPTRLKQILINIIGNAIKFTSHGQVTVRITAPPRNEKGERKLNIQVADTGLGVAPEQQKNLFQPFSQADNSITRRYGGTGLGLILSKKLSQALGGDLILLKSEANVGSTFEITIDISHAIDDLSLPAAEAAPALPAHPTLDGCRVLIVDDSPDNQMLISRMLNLAGAEADIASNGAEGLEKALTETYDVVLMDVQMPVLGGHEATIRLRTKGYTGPIIALTAHAMKEDRDKSLEAGCNEYLTKPIRRMELIEKVSACWASR